MESWSDSASNDMQMALIGQVVVAAESDEVAEKNSNIS